MLAQISTRLSKKTQIAQDIWLLQFSLIDPKSFSFVAGQYMILPVKTSAGETINRLYSIASQDGKTNAFELLVETIPNGLASVFFIQLKINDRVNFQGPAGVFSLKKTNRPAVFLVTGTGLAPVRSILLSNLSVDNRPFYLFWGLPTKEKICLVDELRQLSLAHPNFQTYICLSRETDLSFIKEGDKNRFILGRINNGLETVFPKLDQYDFYLCGGRLVVESLKNYLIEKGVLQQSIFFEKF